MFQIGLTGSIAAGKSLVAARLKEKGVPVWDADLAAREVVEPGRPALAAIAQAFGREMLDGEGRLDRKKLGAIIFADAKEREKLNAITHPEIFADRERMCKMAKERGERIFVADIPLLFETGAEKDMDISCVVYCRDEIRLGRLIERDGLTREEAALRMASQMPQEEKLRRADVVIDNSGAREDTLRQVDALLKDWWQQASAEVKEK